MELVPEPPENDLERALRLAATDPAARPAFYETLLGATVYAIGPPKPEGDAAGVENLKAGDTISMITWERTSGEPIVPFFTSCEALSRTLSEPATFVALPARAFFEITAGAWLVLNPNLGHAKEFSPDEVTALLAGGLPGAPTPRVVQEDTTVMIGQPVERPEVLLAMLARFFGTRPAVRSARLALMHDPSRGEAPTLLLGIEADASEEDVDRLMHAIGAVAADAAPEGQAVDLVRVDGAGSFLSSVEPFYHKASG